MVDSTKTTVTEQIGTTPSEMDNNLTTDPIVKETIKNFKEIQQSILEDIKNPQITANAYEANIDALLHQLRTAID